MLKVGSRVKLACVPTDYVADEQVRRWFLDGTRGTVSKIDAESEWLVEFDGGGYGNFRPSELVEAYQTEPMEFIEDVRRFNAGMTYEETRAEAVKINDLLKLDDRVWSFDSPMNGIFHIENQNRDYLERDFAPKLAEAGYLLHKIDAYGKNFRLFFGVAAPENLWERGDLFRLETLEISSGLDGEAQRYAFERQVSDLMRQGWDIQHVDTNTDQVTVALTLSASKVKASDVPLLLDRNGQVISVGDLVHIVMSSSMENLDGTAYKQFAYSDWTGRITEIKGSLVQVMPEMGDMNGARWFESSGLSTLPF